MVALLCNVGSSVNVVRHLRASPSEELPVVQTSLALEEEIENVVDNESISVNSDANSVSNTVNVVDSSHVVSPVVTPVVSVEAPTKTPTAHHQYRLVNQPKTVTTSHVTPVHTISNVQTVPVQTISVKSSAPAVKKTLSSVQTVPSQQYYVVPQTTYSAVKGKSHLMSPTSSLKKNFFQFVFLNQFSQLMVLINSPTANRLPVLATTICCVQSVATDPILSRKR